MPKVTQLVSGRAGTKSRKSDFRALNSWAKPMVLLGDMGGGGVLCRRCAVQLRKEEGARL